MTITIGSNRSSLRAQRQLGEASFTLERTFERLASGQRINRASDDAAGLAIASSLDIQSRIYTQGIRNLNDGISLISIAEGAVGSLKNIVTRMTELAAQAANGSYSTRQRLALHSEFQANIKEYNRILDTTEFNRTPIFSNGAIELNLQAGGSALIAALGTRENVGNGLFSSPVPSFAMLGGNGGAVATGDFNGDGFDDIVVSHSGGLNTLAVLISRGDGTFNSAISFARGAGNGGIMTGDVNGDGIIDVIAGNPDDETVSVLIGNGNGTFRAQQIVQAPNNLYNFALEDVNLDNHLDLVTRDGLFTYVSLGNGNGTFAASRSVETGTNLGYDVSVSDLNGDGIPDLMVPRADTFLVTLLGNGDGTFQAARTFVMESAGKQLFSANLADVDRDGRADVVYLNRTDRTLGIMYGNGDGTFRARQSVYLGIEGTNIAVDDFNNDGIADLFISHAFSGSGINVYLGNGDGTFSVSASMAAGGATFRVVTGDFNNDGVDDIVGAGTGSAGADILLGRRAERVITLSMRRLGITGVSDISITSQNNAREALGMLTAQQDFLNAYSGVLGATRSRINVSAGVLGVGRENYLAAASRITDADIAQESAELVRTRILRESAAAVLAQANQQPAIALRLLGRV